MPKRTHAAIGAPEPARCEVERCGLRRSQDARSHRIGARGPYAIVLTKLIKAALTPLLLELLEMHAKHFESPVSDVQEPRTWLLEAFCADRKTKLADVIVRTITEPFPFCD